MEILFRRHWEAFILGKFSGREIMASGDFSVRVKNQVSNTDQVENEPVGMMVKDQG